MCQLRDYRVGDETTVFQIVKRVLAEYGLSTDAGSTDSDLNNIRESYISKGGLFRIVESNGRPVGSYGLYPGILPPAEQPPCEQRSNEPCSPEHRSCELRKMYLLPEYRGRGLGKRMMEDALREAKARGFHEMTLETNSCLKEALALYRAYGFTEIAPDHLSHRCDLAMKRPL